jgi:mRNA interferase HigB
MFFRRGNMKNIIAIKTIRDFYEQHPDAKTSLLYWIQATRRADWKKPFDVVADFPSADPVKNNRVVFNIAHNKYRLVVEISYQRQWVFIRFLGTHAAYDQIDASTV